MILPPELQPQPHLPAFLCPRRQGQLGAVGTVLQLAGRTAPQSPLLHLLPTEGAGLRSLGAKVPSARF